MGGLDRSCRQSLFFEAPGVITLHEAPLPAPAAGQVLVRAWLSAISPGTEMLIYRGQFPSSLALDENLTSLAGGFAYPLKYGYSAVGQVVGLGEGVDPVWEGRWVFAFNPHESCFLVEPGGLLPLPEGVDADDAVFLPNMETAVSLVMDGAPLIGERVAVLGQGVVGLLTTALLSRFPLERLAAYDPLPLRRRVSLELGAQECHDPYAAQFPAAADADLVYELSGSPAALDLAIALAAYSGRIVVGSWYGSKRASLDLGGRFHRERIRLVSSQVSTLAPELRGRWSKERRFALAWDMLRQVRPANLITHRFALAQAGRAYELIDQHPDQALQVILTYD